MEGSHDHSATQQSCYSDTEVLVSKCERVIIGCHGYYAGGAIESERCVKRFLKYFYFLGG